MDKKRAEISLLGTLAAIVLVVFLIVILIYGFTVGWGNFFSKLINIGGGKINVQDHVTSCQLACSTQASFDYCTKQRKIVFNDDKNDPKNNEPYTCKQLEDPSLLTGLEPCSTLACDQVPAQEQPVPLPQP